MLGGSDPSPEVVAALAKVAAHDTGIAAMNERMDAVEERQTTIDRQVAAQVRVNSWLGEVLQSNTTAITKIARKLGIEDIDPQVPVLWPE
jgi:hypothetical protein